MPFVYYTDDPADGGYYTDGDGNQTEFSGQEGQDAFDSFSQGELINTITDQNGTIDKSTWGQPQDADQAFQAAEAQKDRDWQKEMQDTYWQRTVADWQAAGLNPATLSSNGISGSSSTPGGAQATTSTTSQSDKTANAISNVSKVGLFLYALGKLFKLFA